MGEKVLVNEKGGVGDNDRDNDRVDAVLSALQQEVLSFSKTEKTRQEIFNHIGLKYHTDNYKRHIEPLINQGLLRMTVPDKPNSKNQRYIAVS